MSMNSNIHGSNERMSARFDIQEMWKSFSKETLR
ncbi:hypothetical protein JOD43_000812 [Pullulanibacillus pueri]|nr:hypothetical protein [Pullulanibacillus pueri]